MIRKIGVQYEILKLFLKKSVIWRLLAREPVFREAGIRTGELLLMQLDLISNEIYAFELFCWIITCTLFFRRSRTPVIFFSDSSPPESSIESFLLDIQLDQQLTSTTMHSTSQLSGTNFNRINEFMWAWCFLTFVDVAFLLLFSFLNRLEITSWVFWCGV